MKSSIETLLVPQNLYQNEHSPRFEELAVVLPEQVIHLSLGSWLRGYNSTHCMPPSSKT
nr:hypothetical protein [Psychrobacter sp. PraFG1]UNK05781.1 hypothetical protein MN210_02985 [Psychrobacter sp. PraFG1]